MVRALGPRLTILPVIVGFGALAAIIAMTFWLNARTQTLFENVVAVRAVRSEAVDLRNALQTAESSQRGYLYTHNEVYLAPFNVSKSQALRQLKLLQAGLADYPSLQAASNRLGEVVQQKFEEMNQSVLLQQQQKDAEALAFVKTNHGKSLMDEADVYLGGMIRAADQRLLNHILDQQSTAGWLRFVSVLSALVIVVVVGLVSIVLINYTRRLNASQAEVTALNSNLEKRVEERTTELGHANDLLRVARDRAEALLGEVNHRIANSLTMVAALVKLQANLVTDKAAKNALAETRERIFAVSLVHRKLYTRGDVRFVLLDDYLGSMLAHLQDSINDEQRSIVLQYQIAPLTLPIDQSINLGVILNEWVSNAVKYAYPDGKGEIRVDLMRIDNNKAELTVADDGVGIDRQKQPQGTGFGTKIVGTMALSLKAEISYEQGNPGTIAKLVFPLPDIILEKPDQGNS